MDLTNPGIGNGLILAVLGFAIVFVGLVFLIIVIVLLAKIMGMKKQPAPAAAAAAPAPVAAPAPAPVAPAPAAPSVRKSNGKSEGTVDTGDVNPRTAAMLMAIVADESGSPIDELEFKSIKEVDGGNAEGK